MKSALSILILFLSLQSAGQQVTELNDSTVVMKYTTDKPVRIRVIRKADSSWLTAGTYKITIQERQQKFQVGDSGLLDGPFIDCFSLKSCVERKYVKGLQEREYYRSGGYLISESFDSTVSIMRFDSKKIRWVHEQKRVTVEKSYKPSGELTRLSYTKGPYDQYAGFRYNYGVLISETIPHYLERKWDQSGRLLEQTDYNWKKKQIEVSRFEKGILTRKMIMKSSANRWDPKGVIHYSTDPDAPMEITTFTYAEGKRIIQKELEEPGNRIVTNYDAKGKIVSINTYPKRIPAIEVDVVAPVEIKQYP